MKYLIHIGLLSIIMGNQVLMAKTDSLRMKTLSRKERLILDPLSPSRAAFILRLCQGWVRPILDNIGKFH